MLNARFAKPLDRQLILDQARGKRLVVTFEESVVVGGFGSGVVEAVEEAPDTPGLVAQVRETIAALRLAVAPAVVEEAGA